MSEFYFEIGNGFITVDGALAKSGFNKDKDFCLGCHCDGFRPTFVAVSATPRKAISPLLSICDTGGGRYFLTFSPERETETEAVILFQTVCTAGGVTHLITHCRKGGYSLVMETAEEIHEISCPCALSDIKVSAAVVKGGHILKLSANAGDKKLLALLYYGGDYVPMFTQFCDDCSFDGADVVYTQYLGGCNRCYRTKKLTLKNGTFCESETSFVYKRNHDYPDELIPYVFLERLLFQDYGGAEELLRRGMSISAARDILKDFDAVADFSFIPYRPYVAGVYKRAPLCTVSYYSFKVADGLISEIIPFDP